MYPPPHSPDLTPDKAHKPASPPRWLNWLLEKYCADHLYEEILGDLHERYALRAQRLGEAKARRLYFREVLSYLHAGTFRRKSPYRPSSPATDMLRNHFTITFRNLWRQKSLTAINVAGLSIGIATCLLITLFVAHELSFDRYNEKAARMVRVTFKGSVQGQALNEPHVMPPVAHALRADYPEVQEATRLRRGGTPVVRSGGKLFQEHAVALVDSNFFQVFTLPFVAGNPKTALVQPNTVVITQEAARKYFGNQNPLGKVLRFENTRALYTVTGVMEPVPANAHFHFDLFVSLASLPDARSSSWMTSEYFTYLVLPEGYDYKRLAAKLPGVVEKYVGPQLKQAMGMDLAQFRQKGNDLGLFLQPLTDIHLHADSAFELEPSGDIRYVYLFSAIAVFMLVIACINFVNLSTAGAARRAKEVGIRKVMGSPRGELVRQFLAESVVMAGIALLAAAGLVFVALPFFNQLAGKELNLGLVASVWAVPSLLLFGLLVGVLAGSYPAFYLSSFKPVSVLKSKFTAGRQSVSLRSSLVVFQFFVSITLLVCTGIVYQQLSYMQNKKLGYDKEQVLVVQDTWRLGRNEEVLRKELLSDARVVNASISGYLPAGPTNNNNFFVYADAHASQLVKTLRYQVDHRYIPTLGMTLVAGRNFSVDFATDSTAVVINETAAKAFGWGGQAVGHTLTHSDNEGKKTTYQVVGVVKDFHFKPLHERISPLVMVLGNNSGALIVKVKTKDITGLVAGLEKQWKEWGAETPFAYSFLDDRFAAAYRSEQKVGQILALFAGLTIFVACLGLFGLTLFTAQRRQKEIGIRKVVGASVGDIVALLSLEFLGLVLLANLLAWPVVYYLMSRWLEGFQYRVALSPWIFAGAGAAALLIAVLTVSFQSVKAALTDPVRSLRSE